MAVAMRFLQFFDAGDAVDANGQFICACAADVDVGVVEAGHDEMIVELDGFDVVAGAALEHDLLDAADADDFAVADGHGGGPGVRGIVGVDAAVEVDRGVSGWRGLGLGGGD